MFSSRRFTIFQLEFVYPIQRKYYTHLAHSKLIEMKLLFFSNYHLELRFEECRNMVLTTKILSIKTIFFVNIQVMFQILEPRECSLQGIHVRLVWLAVSFW
jgi:hypothetical protein